MNKLKKLAVATLLGTVMFSTTATANVKKGQKIFLKKLKSPCDMSGSKFAHTHTQDEWEKIYEAGKFATEVKKVCPKLKKVKEKYVPHLYDFVYEYASDSGNIPSC